LELGRKPTGPASFFDDVDRNYVVAQLEGRMDAPVDLTVVARRSSPLALTPAAGAEEAARAERLASELAALEPRIRVTVTGEGAGEVPAFTVASPASVGTVRFVGVPRVNLFRALLEAVRRASTGDHGVAASWAEALNGLPRPVHARVFATPT
jgi:alkyl hydroperoxide reductase subunit AhpF